MYDAKRIIGKSFQDPSVQAFLAKWEFSVVSDDQDRCKILVPGE